MQWRFEPKKLGDTRRKLQIMFPYRLARRLFVRVLAFAFFAPALISRDCQAGGMAFDATGNLYLSAGPSVLKFAPDGTQSTFASGLNNAFGLAFDHQGNLFVSDIGTQTVYRFAPDGTKSAFVTGTSSFGMAFDASDNLYLARGAFVLKFTPEGAKSTFVSGLGEALDLGFDSSGMLFVLDTKGDFGKTLYMYNPDGAKTSFIPFIRLYEPGGLAVDAKDNVYLAQLKGKDPKQAILKFSSKGEKSTFAEAADGIALGSVAVDKAGNAFVFNGVSMSGEAMLKYDDRGARPIAASPDGQWIYQLVGEQFPEIVKAGEKEAAVDLSKDRTVPHATEASVAWAPDSKSFAYHYSPPHMAHTSYDTVAVYQLRGSEWVLTDPLVDLESDLSQLAQLGKGRLSKKLSREHAGDRDILKLRKWIDGETAVIQAYSDHSASKAPPASYDFTVKFNAQGKWKILQMHPAPAKE